MGRVERKSFPCADRIDGRANPPFAAGWRRLSVASAQHPQARRIIRFKNELASDPKDGLDLVQAGFNEIDKLVRDLDAEKPWTHPKAARLDETTFAEWLRDYVPNEDARAMVGAEVGPVACASPEEISILEIAFLMRACDSIDHLFDGAQELRLVNGTQPIAKAVADKLGDAVKLSALARRIQWNDDGAVVFSDDISVAARHVIVATPPHLAGAIDYDPSPPTDRVQVTQRWPQDLVIKIAMV